MVCVTVTAQAQILTPVKWQCSIEMDGTGGGRMTFTAAIDAGWHMYAMDLPEGGPVALAVSWDRLEGVALDGGITPSVAPQEVQDDVFGMTLRWWAHHVTLTQKFVAEDASSIAIEGSIRYMACNDKTCQAPTTEPFSFHSPGAATPAQEQVTASAASTWAPVDTAVYGRDSVTGRSFWYIFLAGFLGGLLALLTPCVWPMIPLTVSFFLKKGDSRRRGVRDAVLYGVSIIFIYLLLGLLITAICGASSLNALSTNAVFNILFFLLLVVFAASFLGAFDLRLPDSWASRVDSKADATTGIVSIFFMAFTLTLVSFSCTGPIIGTLLVEASTQGDITGPAVGMGGFAIALALPFTLFAIFPSWLKQMPKSGGWLNSVKVVLGFIELALSLKFLSVADLAYGWGILSREVFVALWLVISALLGFYLLGKIRFKHDETVENLGVARFILAVLSLSFSVYLLPGLWGAPLKSVSAFLPPLSTQDFNLYGDGATIYGDYDAGLAWAATEGKPVLLDFSGYGCVNCRKMEAAVLDDNRVRDIIKEDFVLVRLMVDDKTRLPEPVYVVENGKRVKLSTVGDRWSYLQRHKFKANSQPYYVVVDANGGLLSGPYFYDESLERFLDFLNEGKNRNKKQ